MIKEMLYCFFSFFSVYPNALGLLLAWLLALAFGAIWLACYRPPLITKPWLWAVFAGGAVLAPIAIVVTAFPLRYGVSWAFGSIWSRETLAQWAVRSEEHTSELQ